MLILLSDGAGLTSRQCATVLDQAGYQAGALSSSGLCLARMTRHVRRVHPVPAVGRDPFGWLEAALGVAARRRAGVRTHQLLLAILGAAQHDGRRGVARELRDGLLHRGGYRDSREELTPGGGDLLAGLPVALTALATLVRLEVWRSFAGGSTGAYSLTPAAWEELRRAGAAVGAELFLEGA